MTGFHSEFLITQSPFHSQLGLLSNFICKKKICKMFKFHSAGPKDKDKIPKTKARPLVFANMFSLPPRQSQQLKSVALSFEV